MSSRPEVGGRLRLVAGVPEDSRFDSPVVTLNPSGPVGSGHGARTIRIPTKKCRDGTPRG